MSDIAKCVTFISTKIRGRAALSCDGSNCMEVTEREQAKKRLNSSQLNLSLAGSSSTTKQTTTKSY
ncbi:hypothetical protein TSAR_012750, partial [Trichomalopsis sarcophagae]